MRNITSKPRSCEIRALLACRDLREAPEHPLELVRLPKQERSARKRRKKVLTLDKKKNEFFFFVLLIVLWLTPKVLTLGKTKINFVFPSLNRTFAPVLEIRLKKYYQSKESWQKQPQRARRVKSKKFQMH